MALFEIFHDGSGLDSADPETGVLSFATDSQIEITAGTLTFDYFGSFSYDQYGQIAGGTFTGFQVWDSANGGLQASVSGLNIGIDQFFEAASEGGDAFDQMLFSGNDTIIGGAEDDELDGLNGADSVVGGAGNDTLTGDPGGLFNEFDTLVGGIGNDTYHVAPGTVIVEDAGAGYDSVFTDASYTLSANIEALTLTGTGEANGTGNDQDNLITGNLVSNLLVGMGGNDTLDGGGGPGGVDTLRGGTGDDVYTDGPTGHMIVQEAAGEGNDTVLTWTDTVLADNVENLVAMGSNSIGISGNDLANVITGNDAGDSIRGGGGDDTLIGGTGNDTFYVENLNDVVRGGGGHDEVWMDVSGYVLASGIENLTFGQEDGITVGYGNDLDNYILGNAEANMIFGEGGNDTIFGFFGEDTIDGGDGIDHFVFPGGLWNSQVVRVGDEVVIVSNIVTDPVITLRNIERIDEGLNGTSHLALDIDGNAGKAYRLYQAAFDRKPDLGGLGYQMHDLDTGVTLEQVASNFIASPEFQATYGNVDDTQFITLLYRNVLNREPDAGGLQYHLDELAHNQTRADVLIHFSESPENQANVIGDIANGMEYIW